MQAGEKRFARRLEQLLEDDYLCWYEIPVGKRQRYTDFIILHPARGLLLLEVKDWKLDSLQRIDKMSATILTPSGAKTVANPIEQVRQCTYQLINRLEKDTQLRHESGQYEGRLVFPYGYGVVFANIMRSDLDNPDLGHVLPPHQLICKDEMTEGMDAEKFQEKLWGMFNVVFPHRLTLPQVDRIRWHIFPEVRVNEGGSGSLFPDEKQQEDTESLVPDIVRVMDMQQEQLARSLGGGHRVIHGVAGSGKTMILGFRCLQLAEQLNKPILVLCYNIALAAKLRSIILEKGIDERVHIYHFHDWCGEQLKLYHINKPVRGDGYVERLVDTVAAGVERGAIPKGQYGALLIDEAHDFQADWLKLVVQMVDPDTNSLLILYDDAQSIYKRKNQLDFSLSSVGVEARGRTTILKLNYRNTVEILGFAYRLAKSYIGDPKADGEHVPIVVPEATGKHGPEPVIKYFPSIQKEAVYTAKVLSDLHRKGNAWKEMCVTYSQLWIGKEIEKALREQKIPYQLLSTSADKKQFNPAEESVKLMTVHSSKGLEFPIVAVIGLGYMPSKKMDLSAEAKLLYVALTRSTEKLLLTYHKRTEFTDILLGSKGRATDAKKSA